ncbi:MAG TPA: ABC transporter substrate-binding protein [Burkholderiales bacterium]|nr:ABC transporter substrate-binding protein [Burkholderiales bacterium]
MRTRAWLRTAAVGAFAWFALAAAGAALAAEPVKIGFSVSLTGGTDDYGKAAMMGFKLALKEYNAKGGYKGQPVEAVIYDDETKPAKGVENVTRLITRDNVVAIVGPVNSGVALAIIDIAQKQQITLMDTIATAEDIIKRYSKEPKNYIFRVSLNDGIQTSFMIDYIQKKGLKKIGLMHDSTGWGQSGRDTALRLMKEANIPVSAGPEVFDQNDTDMTPQLTKMKEANVDFIIAYSLAPAGVQIAKSMQKIGIAVPWTGTWGLLAPNFLRLGGKDLTNGVMAVTSYTVDHSENAKKFHAWVDKEYAADGGDFWPVATAQTYDGTRLVLRALDKVAPDPARLDDRAYMKEVRQKMRDAVESIDDFTTAVTKMKPRPFAPDNHESLGRDSGFLAIWRDGKVVRAQ